MKRMMAALRTSIVLVFCLALGSLEAVVTYPVLGMFLLIWYFLRASYWMRLSTVILAALLWPLFSSQLLPAQLFFTLLVASFLPQVLNRWLPVRLSVTVSCYASVGLLTWLAPINWTGVTITWFVVQVVMLAVVAQLLPKRNRIGTLFLVAPRTVSPPVTQK